MEREAHVKLIGDTVTAYRQLFDYWNRQVKQKGPVGDWPSMDMDRFSREVVEPMKFLREELGRLTEELRRHDLGVSHNDFGDSGRAKSVRQAAGDRARQAGG